MVGIFVATRSVFLKASAGKYLLRHKVDWRFCDVSIFGSIQISFSFLWLLYDWRCGRNFNFLNRNEVNFVFLFNDASFHWAKQFSEIINHGNFFKTYISYLDLRILLILLIFVIYRLLFRNRGDIYRILNNSRCVKILIIDSLLLNWSKLIASIILSVLMEPYLRKYWIKSKLIINWSILASTWIQLS